MNGLSQKVYDFVDERIDLKTLEAKMMNEPIKGGSRWAYVFGSCLLFIFIMQAITGMLLMFYYIPSADHAYASTQYIIHEVDYGWFILSYHFWLVGDGRHGLCAHVPGVFVGGLQETPGNDLAGRAGLVCDRDGLRLYRLSPAVGSAGLLGHDSRRRDHGQDAHRGRFPCPVLERWAHAGTNDLEPVLRHPCHDSSGRPDGAGRAPSLFLSLGRAGRSVPRGTGGVKGQDRFLLPAPGLERHRRD